MQILIVNGHTNTAQGRRTFADFQFVIYKLFKEQKDLIDTDTEFFVRDRNNIDDYLFQLNSAYIQKENAKNFDFLDMIFITGDANMRPWEVSCQQLLVLLRMCLRVRKIVFACSFGMQGLVYLAASNFEKPYNVVNGGGYGSTITSLVKLNIDPKTLTPSDIFIDNVTGDIYFFNFESQRWVPRGNAGIHSHKAAQEFQSLGQFILKAPVYRPQKIGSDDNIYLNSSCQSVCFIKKRYLSHWINQGQPFTFKIPTQNSWDVHTFASMNPDKQFIILAQSQRGPVIIEFKHMIATQFEISEKYAETVNCFKNFVRYYSDLYKAQQLQIFSVLEAIPSILEQNSIFSLTKDQSEEPQFKQREIKFNNLVSNDIKNVKNSLQMNEDQKRFKHVGFTATMTRNMATVENNAIRGDLGDFTDDGKVKYANVNQLLESKKTVQKLKYDINFFTTDDDQQRENMVPPHLLMAFQNETNQKQNKDDTNTKISMQMDSQESIQIDDQYRNLYYENWDKNQVRAMLHPQLGKEILDTKDQSNWVPGYLKSHKTQKNVIQIQSDDVFIRGFYQTQSELNNTFKKDFGQLTQSVFATQMSVDPDFVMKHNNNSNQILKTDFMTTGSQFSVKDQGKYKNRTNSPQNLHSHQFRAESSNQWLYGAFKFN